MYRIEKHMNIQGYAYRDTFMFYPPPDKIRAGVIRVLLQLGYLSVRLSAFRFWSRSRDFFDFAHTHPLGGVDVTFGVFVI